MTQAQPDHSRFEKLIEAHLCDTLDDTGRHELVGLLDADRALSTAFIEYMNLHAELSWHRSSSADHGPDGPQDRTAAFASYTSTEHTATMPFSRLAQYLSDRHRPRVAFWATVTALTAMFLAGLVFLVGDRGPQPEVAQAPPTVVDTVARITGQHECRWVSQNKSVEPATDLYLGEHVEIAAGLLEITYHSGSSVIVEGPATLVVSGRNASDLRRGRLVARVPQKARGFVVSTPSGTITDLGTEFGAQVLADGSVQVAVLSGEVQVKSHPTAASHSETTSTVLLAGEHVEIDSSGELHPTANNTADFEHFVRHASRLLRMNNSPENGLHYDVASQIGHGNTPLSVDPAWSGDTNGWVTMDFNGTSYLRNQNDVDCTIRRRNDRLFGFDVPPDTTRLTFAFNARVNANFMEVGLAAGNNTLFRVGIDADGNNQYHVSSFDGSGGEVRTTGGTLPTDAAQHFRIVIDTTAHGGNGSAVLFVDKQATVVVDNMHLLDPAAPPLTALDTLWVYSSSKFVGPGTMSVVATTANTDTNHNGERQNDRPDGKYHTPDQ